MSVQEIAVRDVIEMIEEFPQDNTVRVIIHLSL